MTSAPPTVLIVSGLDPTGCAGFLLDARVVSHVGARTVGAVAVLTEQSSDGLRRAEPVSDEVVGDQVRALLSEHEVAAVKLGALGSVAIAERVADALALTRAPVVWDPVATASSGGPPLSGDLLQTAAVLAPHLSLVTPNRAEAAALLEVEPSTLDPVAAAAALAGPLDCAVLVTGGHFGGDAVVDVFAHVGATDALSAPRIENAEHIRGTGCALSSAIAAHIAMGAAPRDAIEAARALVRERMAEPIEFGRSLRSLF